MKTTLLFVLALAGIVSYSQPVITGDTVLCPNSTGTAYVTGDVTYDSYEWYFKYWFSEDDFQLIEGATSDSFTYDWFTYDQALIKVVATLNGQSFESNTIQIDSWNWLPISMGYGESENISTNPDNGNVMLCAGTSFTVEVFNPFSANIRWYRDNVLIEGENSMTLEISEPGVYHVTASPGMCPDNESTTAGTPIIVEIDNNCSLGVPSSGQLLFSVFPNPVQNTIHVLSPGAISSVAIFNSIGQKVLESKNSMLDTSLLSSGVYIIKVTSDEKTGTARIVKQ